MPKSDFNKVAVTLRHGCSPVNLLHIFRTPFTKNTSKRLLLHLLKTALLYRKDHLRGHSSNVCTNNKFFQEEVFFLRKEPDNKQETIDSLLNIVN